MRDVRSTIGNRLFIFDSQNELISYVSGEHYRPRGSSRGSFFGFGGDEIPPSEWMGRELPSWPEVLKVSKEVWDEGITVMTEYLTRLKDIKIEGLKDRRRKFTWHATEGDEYDTDRAAQGLPAWKKYAREESKGATEVTILTDVTTEYHRDSMDILWRGAAAVALTQILESKGYRTEVWAAMGSKLFEGFPGAVITAVNLKRTSDPLDVSTLINTVSGWYYRSADFALFDTLADKTGNEVSPGYGRAYPPRTADLDEISRDPNRIWSSGVFTFNGVADMLEREVARIQESAGEKADGQG